MVITGQNACMCRCRHEFYQSKVNITSFERFKKPYMQIRNGYLLQPHHFLPSQPPFWRKIEELCGCFDPIYDFRLVLYHSKVNNISYETFMKPEMGIMDGVLLQPHHFLQSKDPPIVSTDIAGSPAPSLFLPWGAVGRSARVIKVNDNVMPLAATTTVANNVKPLAAAVPLAAAAVAKQANKLRTSNPSPRHCCSHGRLA